MSDLHVRLLAEIERREAIALAARGVLVAMTPEARAYWNVHDSADALLRYSHYRRVLGLVDGLRRHADKRRTVAQPSGWADDLDAYADELEIDLADALGIPIEEPATNG